MSKFIDNGTRQLDSGQTDLLKNLLLTSSCRSTKVSRLLAKQKSLYIPRNDMPNIIENARFCVDYI
jgi:hypothetical protein